MTTQLDLFYIGNSAAGALAVAQSSGTYATHIVFSPPDSPVVDLRTTIDTDASVKNWSRFTFHNRESKVEGIRTEDGVLISGRLVRCENVVPSYGVSALVLELVDSKEDRCSFLWLDESRGASTRPVAGKLEQAGRESVDSPVGVRIPACERVELTVDNARTNTYWVKDGVIVASDWNGATSYALPDAVTNNLQAALALIDHETAT